MSPCARPRSGLDSCRQARRSQACRSDAYSSEEEEDTSLALGTENVLPIEIVTNGTDDKILQVTLTPQIMVSANENGFMLEVQYAYNHPQNGRTRTMVVRCTRSNTPIY